VLGPAVATIGGIAAGEALKLLAGRAEAAWSGFLHADLAGLDFQRVAAARDPACPCCAARDFPWLDGRRGTRAAEPVCGGNAVQVPLDAPAADLTAVAAKLRGTVAELQEHPRYLRWRARGLDLFLFADGRALVRGTEDPARARAALAETLGG
jgi:adenylyltransferase/sulfurtransferase